MPIYVYEFVDYDKRGNLNERIEEKLRHHECKIGDYNLYYNTIQGGSNITYSNALLIVHVEEKEIVKSKNKTKPKENL